MFHTNVTSLFHSLGEKIRAKIMRREMKPRFIRIYFSGIRERHTNRLNARLASSSNQRISLNRRISSNNSSLLSFFSLSLFFSILLSHINRISRLRQRIINFHIRVFESDRTKKYCISNFKKSQRHVRIANTNTNASFVCIL